MLTALAQTTSKSIGPVLINLGVLIAVVVAMGFIILLVRKWMLSVDRGAESGSLFDDLKRLRDSGEISELEHDYLRKSIAAMAAGKEPPARPPELAPTELRARPGFDLTGAPLPPEVVRAQRRQRENGS